MKSLKVAIYYPPVGRGGEIPLLAQNRQFKFSKSAEIRIYPVVMATLATMLSRQGCAVLWLDGINLRYSRKSCDERLRAFGPDLIVLETKAPLLARHLEVARDLKRAFDARIVMCGDHVSFFPEQALAGDVDYVVAGGDYDFAISRLAAHLRDPAAPMPGGVYARREGGVVCSGNVEDYDLDAAPIIDRDLTRWAAYGEAYLYKPAAYIMSGRGCGGANRNESSYESSAPGVCTFCIWQHAFWRCGARMRSPASVAEEVEQLVRTYHVREIFDDNESGAVWSAKWLAEFHKELRARRLLGKVRLSSNARADSLTPERAQMLREMGYRLLKVGLESGNDATLARLRKNETAEQIAEGIRNAKRAGLRVLITTMVGYPWEGEADAQRTYELTRSLMLYKTHFGDSLQSSIITPYPGTPLYNLAEKQGWLTEHAADYTKYDMSHHILKTDLDTVKWCRRMWSIHLHPLFVLKSFLSLRRAADARLAWHGLTSLLGHLRDYEANPT
ncbi:MAG: radical SAM protein [Kiritimatiellae bacterium]|nr:radical SAM protein [Kiritimatiellia bacterium]